jgi:hypothetical protein
MAEPLVDIFKDIANSIRFKEGSDKKLKPEYFYANIMNLAEVNTADATATAADILDGKVAYGQGQRIVGTMAPGVPQAEYDSLLAEKNTLQSQVNTLSTNLTNAEKALTDAFVLVSAINGISG